METKPKRVETTDTASEASSIDQVGRSHTMTPYNTMLVDSHEVPYHRNIAAAVSNWLLLAGFMVFPGTFTSLSRAGILSNSSAGRVLQQAVRNTPLLYVASFSCFLGIMGIAWLWWNLKHNYIWLLHRIFLPSLLNSVVALLTSLINIYTAQSGDWSIMAIVTVSIVGSCVMLMGSMVVTYQFWFLKRLRQES